LRCATPLNRAHTFLARGPEGKGRRDDEGPGRAQFWRTKQGTLLED